MYISVIECRTIDHRDMDVSCVSFTPDEMKSRHGENGGSSHGLSKIYFGTSQGPVLSYGCQIGSAFGEGERYWDGERGSRVSLRKRWRFIVNLPNIHKLTKNMQEALSRNFK